MRPIEDYRREYADPHNGFDPDGDGDDWLPAFERAMHEHLVPLDPSRPDDEDRFRTYRTTVLLGPRSYRLSDTLHLYRGLTIRGEGSRTVLHADHGGDGIVMHFLLHDQIAGTHPSGYGGTGHGGFSQLEDFYLVGSNAPGSVGVRMYVSGGARGVRVSRFGWHAWRIDADAKRTQRSNANLWSLVDCSAIDCGHLPGVDENSAPRLPGSGLALSGGDSNAGYSLRFNAIRCKGWAIDDDSYLGNTHIQPHAADCGEAENAPAPYHEPLAYRSEGGQRTTWVNPYVEAYARVDIPAPSMRLGGIGGEMTPESRHMEGGTFTGIWDFVGSAEELIFTTTDLTLVGDLDAMLASAPLRQLFSAHGSELGNKVLVKRRRTGIEWRVNDVDQQQSYAVRLHQSRLCFFRIDTFELELGDREAMIGLRASRDKTSWPYRLKYVAPVHPEAIFAIDAAFASELDEPRLSDDLRQVFAEHCLTLKENARIIVEQAGERWLVQQDPRYEIERTAAGLAVRHVERRHAGFYRFDQANLNSGVALLLTSSKSQAPSGRELPKGRLVLPEHYFGNGIEAGPWEGYARRGYGDGPPNQAGWPVGSRFENTRPQSGGFAGWVVVSVGPNDLPEWRGYGRIE